MIRITGFPFLLFFILVGDLPAKAFEGLVQPRREVVVSSPVESILQHIAVEEGDRVEEGVLLARLYSRRESLEVERSKALLEKREFENKSAQNLFADQLISEDEALERQIELNIAKILLEIAEEELARRQIEAPIRGVVVEKLGEEGEMVRPGDPLFRIVQVETVRVQFFLSVSEARGIEPGDVLPVVFPELGDAPVRQGEVDFIDPTVDAASGLMRVRVVVENGDFEIKPGMRARIERVAEASAGS